MAKGPNGMQREAATGSVGEEQFNNVQGDLGRCHRTNPRRRTRQKCRRENRPDDRVTVSLIAALLDALAPQMSRNGILAGNRRESPEW